MILAQHAGPDIENLAPGLARCVPVAARLFQARDAQKRVDDLRVVVTKHPPHQGQQFFEPGRGLVPLLLLHELEAFVPQRLRAGRHLLPLAIR